MAANDPCEAHGSVPLDHVLFHAGQALGELASFFERIGFTLTPLGRHSSGSVNRLAILQDTYLELIGFEPGTPATVRPEVQSLPLGLSGVAAADREQDRRTQGRDAFLPSRRLERPVDMPGVHGVAAFTTTELRAGPPDVRVFLCRHHTPQLVWHPAWQRHANGAFGVAAMRLRSRDPEGLHAALRRAFDIAAPQDAQSYDAAGTTVCVAAPDERPSLTVRTRDLPAARAVLAAAGVHHTQGDGTLSLALPAPYDVQLVFAGT